MINRDEGLQLDGLSHRYGETLAIDNVSLSVRPGEVMCLVGPSGCGKSTTLRLAAGLETLQQGMIKLDGRLIADNRHSLPPEARGLGFVFQDFALFPHMNVAENIGFGLGSATTPTRGSIIEAMLRRVHMEHRAKAYPHQLSGGEQQRVALARALAPSPKLVLLDEPFSGLDTRLRDAVRDETLALLRESGAPAMMVTHDATEAMRMADRIAILRDGRMQQCGAPDDIYFRPANAFVAGFFGPVNVLEGEIRNHVAHTALGPFPAQGLPDASKASVVVRYEGISLVPASRTDKPQASNGIVTSARLLGAISEVAVTINPALPAVHAHMAGPSPAIGAAVSLAVAPSMAYVFPDAAETPPAASDT